MYVFQLLPVWINLARMEVSVTSRQGSVTARTTLQENSVKMVGLFFTLSPQVILNACNI